MGLKASTESMNSFYTLDAFKIVKTLEEREN